MFAARRPKPLGVASREEARRSRGFRNELLFTGRRCDPETGLQLNRHRFYHQQLGRWLSRDPIGYKGSRWNLYKYGKSAPARYRDAFGQKPHTLPGDIPGAIVFPGIADDLRKYGAIDWVSGVGPRYWVFWNDIELPKSFFDDDGKVKCDLPCARIGDLANEMFHAWWDQVLEEEDECEWLYRRIKELSQETWTGWPRGIGNIDNFLEMGEEAMSEAASSWALEVCFGREPSYRYSARPPSHNDVGDKWEGNPYADIRMPRELFDLLEHAMRNGCKRIGKYASQYFDP
jgi:RHS repeat-associated protein